MVPSLHPLYELPIPWTVAIILAVLLLCVELSYRIGLAQRKAGKGREQDRRGDVVLTTMLGFLGLILGFTYAFTISRSDARKAAIIEEVNALETAFLRADLLPPPHAEALQSALLDYARTRPLDRVGGGTNRGLEESLERTLAAQAKLWPTTVKSVNTAPTPNVVHSLVVHAVNDVLDAHSNRMMVGFDTLPIEVFFTLVFVAGASLAVAGYSAGRADALRRLRMTALTLVLVSVMRVILDFDRPLSGFIQIDQRGYDELITKMQETLDAR